MHLAVAQGTFANNSTEKTVTVGTPPSSVPQSTPLALT
jgi:hypothetical protein